MNQDTPSISPSVARKRLHRCSRVVLSAALVLAATCVQAFRPPEHGTLPNLDRRASPPREAGAAAARAAAEASLRDRLPQARVAWHETIGSPQWVTANDGFLTGPHGQGRGVSAAARNRFAANDPHAPAKAFVHEHAAMFGHDEGVLDKARVAREYTTEHNGLHTIVWEQEHDGLPIFEAKFIAHVTANGELVNVASQFLADPDQAAGDQHAGAAPSITAEQALILALTSLGSDQPPGDVLAVTGPEGIAQKQQWRASAAKGDVETRLVWLPLSASTMRRCWEVVLTTRARGEIYKLVVDATTGEVWVRHCLTSYLTNASYRVFAGIESPTPLLPGYVNPGSDTQPAPASRNLVTLAALDAVASPLGWINDGVNETVGNNVDAHLDLNDDDVADLPRPQGSPSRVFDFPLNLAQAPSTYRNAAVVNLFYWCNWMHDKLYALGFTEAVGNFQANNFGKGGLGNDAVQADAQDGGDFSNANFGVGGDGSVPRMQMYLYNGPNPDRDADFDVTTILHEYTHGLSGRLVGAGAGITKLQPMGLGEGWSDFYALALLVGPSANLGASYPLGAYSIMGYTNWGEFIHPGDNYYFGVRRYPYCTNLTVDPLTFRDIDPQQCDSHPGVPRSPLFPELGANEVHAMGELWCSLLWDARAVLINKLGFAAGNQLILRIVTDAMKLGPANPTFLAARDAILQAELIDSGGTNRNDLWQVFARRGMGEDALGPWASSTSGVIESFNGPDTLRLLPLNEVWIWSYVGGPYTVISTNFMITNITAAPIGWSASTSSPFSISPATGTIGAHASSVIPVTLNTGQLPMAITNFQVFFSVSNQTSHVVHKRRCQIELIEPLSLQFPGLGVGHDIFTGPLGGPFECIFDGQYRITNASASSMTWALYPPSIYTVTPMSGTLGPKSSIVLDVKPNALAAQLPLGSYTNTLIFSNNVTHTTRERSLELHVRNDSYLTKSYGGVDPLDIQHKTITFIPDVSPSGYAVCLTPAATFPTDPAGGTSLHHTTYSYDDNAEVLLTGGRQVTLHGHNTNRVWVNFEGSVTLDGPDVSTTYSHFSDHFKHLQVSGFFGDYYEGYAIAAGANISWKQTSDRLAVTWQNMAHGYAGKYTNNFQIELFFNGIIRITVLEAHPDSNVVGLSRGAGSPADFIDTDFGSRPTCDQLLPNLYVTAPGSFSEGQGQRISGGQVRVLSPVPSDVIVSLTSNDPSEIIVPATVTIPAGGTGAFFNITVVNDALLDGSQGVILTASAPFYNPGSTTIFVNDNETTVLHLQLPATLNEGGGSSQGKVFTTTPVNDDVIVSLGSTPPGALQLGGFLALTVIPAGQTSAVFQIKAPDNRRIEGPRIASVSATVENWGGATNTLTIIDNETTNLTAFIPLFLGEGAGVLSNIGTVTLSGTLPTNLTVTLFSDAGFSLFPQSPVVIPAGQTNALFNLFVGDNGFIDPLRLVTVTATAPGFSNGVTGALLFDNDGPPDPINPNPPDFSDNIATSANLSWDRVEGELVVNGTFEMGDLTGWTRGDTGDGGFVVNNGSYDPSSPDGRLAPFAGSFSALASQLGNGHHELWQDIAIPAGATFVTVTWADRIRNHAGVFMPHQQQFRVEARDPADNSVLWTLYESKPGDLAMTGWVQRTNYLSAYRGRTIRLAFVEDDELGYLNVHLDNISVQAGSPAPTSFDIYFGTNASPGAAEYVGSTTNNSWALPLLAAGTQFYWRVDVKRAGLTNAGPVWTFRTTGLSSNAALVPFNSIWKYWAQGTDLGTTWHTIGYNDASWPAGAGVLGFGGKQNTLIGNATNGYVTFYFRKKFVVTNITDISDLTARLIRDDGAVVFLNGLQILSDNMPASRLGADYLTQASTVISGTAETTPVTFRINPTMLINGTNTIAVEVHQRHGALGIFSPDLLFDCELRANFNLGNKPPAVALATPAAFTIVTAPTSLPITATVMEDSLAGLTVRFVGNGLVLGTASTPPYSMTWSNPWPGDYTIEAIATDSEGLSVTSAPVHVTVRPATGIVSTLIPRGAAWRFNDSGDDAGTAWTLSDFNDATWRTGLAQFGYGEGDEATLLATGPDPLTHFVTYYFRHAFTNTIAVSGLQLRMLRDDGAVVYLNGTEVWRNNMPSGQINYLTLALTNVGGAEENTFYIATLPPELLNSGVNVLAVEVHQASPSSSDLSFDLELTALGQTKPNVSLVAPAANSLFVMPAAVPIVVTASVAYAQISSVEFFADGVSLGATASPPYQTAWANPTGGTHVLTALVTDSTGSTNWSGPVTITVLAPTVLQWITNGGQPQLSWPIAAGPYEAEWTTNLVSPVTWMPVTNAVQQVNGFFVIPIEAHDPQRFFRLRSP